MDAWSNYFKSNFKHVRNCPVLRLLQKIPLSHKIHFKKLNILTKQPLKSCSYSSRYLVMPSNWQYNEPSCSTRGWLALRHEKSPISTVAVTGVRTSHDRSSCPLALLQHGDTKCFWNCGLFRKPTLDTRLWINFKVFCSTFCAFFY